MHGWTLMHTSSSNLSFEKRVRIYMEELAEALKEEWKLPKGKLLPHRSEPLFHWNMGFVMDAGSEFYGRNVTVDQDDTRFFFVITSFEPKRGKETQLAQGAFSAELSPQKAASVINHTLLSSRYKPY